MAFLKPVLPPWDALEWARKPFPERAKMACEAWAVQGFGSPSSTFLFYGLKIALYVGGWWLFCSFTPGMGDLGSIDEWWARKEAFQKAILWSILFEVLGLGCGSGPLSGRYLPPIGGFLYFLRPGTTKMPPFPGLPLLGGQRRTPLDVALYGALLVVLVATLVSAHVPDGLLITVAATLALIGLADKTIFLAARAEHYWTAVMIFLLASSWVPGMQALWAALWFWAGFSKLNHHFPYVVTVMNSNHPLTRALPWQRKLMYRGYPDDLSPSRWAVIAHGGTALEFAVPILLVLGDGGSVTVVGLVLMVFLHTFITSNVPMGVPLEWNVMMVYGGFVLFSHHAEANILQMPVATAPFLVVMLVLVPLLGNLIPSRISFLMSMRYYAGNWPWGVWLFRDDSHRKLERVKKVAPWVPDQVARIYDERTAVGILSKVMGWRLMHLHGRALPELVPKAVEPYAFEDYEWMDGEAVAGMVLGYNFGEGHLHSEDFLRAVQEQCGFEEGELRVIMAESQPLGRKTVHYRIYDAKTGLIEEGELDVDELRKRQPWTTKATWQPPALTR